MYLKRLEMIGFKTFASRTVLEFRPGITAIVGPNGSGKSNILDSIRWVLGEQSFAALRSKRAEDLIFGGGARRAPSGLAEVALTIDNSDRLLPLAFSEVTFGRRATRSGESEYLLNRSRVRLREIQEAIGPLGGSYTIINQGLVDAALNLRPEERRRLFEDAAEIGIYEQRKSEAERRLRETAANIQRSDDVLADLEPRLRSLKRQASLARSYRDLQEELHGLLLRSYTAQRRAARQTLTMAEQAEQRAATRLAEAHAQQGAANAELLALRNGLRTLREQLQSLHAASSELHDRAETVQRDLAVGNERASAIERRAEDIERERRELELRAAELERDRAEAEQRLAEASARLGEQRALLQEQEQLLSAREAERRAARLALEHAQRAELQAGAALAESRRRTEQLARRRTELARERESLAPALEAARRTAATRLADIEAAEQAVSQAATALEQAAQRAEAARGAIEAARAELARADEAAAQNRRSLADAEARLESLARLQRSYTGAFAGVRAAMQWAEAQQRTGFALVSTIVRTPAELEVAIEVALGSRLQNIVVERWADAEEAIEALKRNGAGRATFLPLDTIRQTTRDERRKTKDEPHAPVLGVAAELVDYNERYTIVVWHLLGRTLIVSDLSTARSELRSVGGGWTIVTLAGEQVSSGGAVTGGAQIRESGALRRERELRELPRQVAELRRTLDAGQRERGVIEARAAAADQERRTAEQERRRMQQELDALRDTLGQARRAASQADADLALQQRRDAQIVSELAELEQQERGLAEERAALELGEAEARERASRLRLEEQERGATDQIDLQRREVLQMAVAAAEGETRAQRGLLQSHGQNAARLGTQREDLAGRAGALGRERAGLISRTQELEAAHTALLAEIDELRRRIDPAEGEVADGEVAQVDLEQRAAALTEALLEGESAHGRATVELQRARDRLDALWERAAADDIDLETLSEDDGPWTVDDGVPQTIDNREGVEDEQRNKGTKEHTLSLIDSQSSPVRIESTIDEQSTISNEPSSPGNRPSSNDDLPARITALRTRMQRMGAVNPLALEEFEETSRRYDFLSAQLGDLRAAERSLTELIAELDAAMQTRFEATFESVAVEFERTFEQLFGGGHARLILTRPDGEEADDRRNGAVGVDIVARPPGKRQQNLALLSGGERTLTAAALLFSILKVNPSPFCVLDEVDAALDEANVGRFREALVELSHQTQFLVITHNRGTIEAADTIYGVSMSEDSASRVLSVRLEEIEE